MRKITSFKEIASDYELYIFDLWGVVHDGVVLLEQTMRFIEYLRSANKKIIYLSNCPRPFATQLASLANKGFALSEQERIVTSGDFFRACFINDDQNMFAGKKIYNLGAECNADLLSGLDVKYAPDIPSADYVILSGFVDDMNLLTKWDNELALANEHNIPAICVNPDVNTPNGNRLRYTPGSFAQKFQDLGGQVYFYGKPYLPIYEYALASFAIEKDRMIVIGDSLATDIKGAMNYGIDSLLLLSGVHAGVSPKSDIAVQQLLSQFEASPTFVIDKPNFA